MTAQPTDTFLPTRQSLLSRLRSWDNHESWTEFFNSYGKLIYTVAKSAGLNDAEAQDVVQETILSVAQEMPGFRYDPAKGSFKGWLKLVTRRRIADYFRSRRVEREKVVSQGPGEALEEEQWSNELDDLWEQQWQQTLIVRALEKVRKQVSARQYQIFDLNVLKEAPASEVAKILGVNLAQIYLAKHRVSALLKKEMKALAAQT
ncbi:MAG TPA: sigma-70 family RNA polymerase sigma factor [Methylomirabilota bacterium]|nr:sigma-70 family RNA polymerase sigma factor [Methylomirabilota bacterium]